MTKTVHAVFDGKALRPEGPVDLEINRHYLLTIEPEEEAVEDDPAFNLSFLSVKTGIKDLASEHDFYLYGKPKRAENNIE